MGRSRRKNDPNDALDIALRLARGECPLGYIVEPQLMQLRKFGRHWRQLSRLLSKAKQGMKSMLNAANIRGPQFDGPRAHRWFLTFGGRDARHAPGGKLEAKCHPHGRFRRSST